MTNRDRPVPGLDFFCWDLGTVRLREKIPCRAWPRPVPGGRLGVRAGM